MLIAAGLLARKARGPGLKPPPGSRPRSGRARRAAANYLRRSGLLADLEALGFGIVGFGCTTCIGNSGPLVPEMAEAIQKRGVMAAAVLSGNRNFPGRVHGRSTMPSWPRRRWWSPTASPGRVEISTSPASRSAAPPAVPRCSCAISGRRTTRSPQRMPRRCGRTTSSDAFADKSGGAAWAALDAPSAAHSPGIRHSTYLRRPPFVALPSRAGRVQELVAAPLIVLGDDITTDHISPAGAIPAKGEAGAWLIERGENPSDLNVFSSRRGNFEAMVRGLFTNRSVRNLLAPDAAPGWTVHAPSGELLPLYRAAERYRAEGVPTVILAGRHYGAGSSRDWAAKGPALLGVRAVLAEASSGSTAPT